MWRQNLHITPDPIRKRVLGGGSMSIRCVILIFLTAYFFTVSGLALTGDIFIGLLCAVAGGFAALDVEKMG